MIPLKGVGKQAVPEQGRKKTKDCVEWSGVEMEWDGVILMGAWLMV